ncbi:MAG: hypothetical protein IPI67_31865 [Myxococcales bacterium]|nr:hypothetical protein [Myxococcales bacterium]
MKRALGLVFGLAAFGAVACGSSGSGDTGSGGSSGAGGTGASSGAGGGAADAQSDAPPPGEGCAKAGGTCGCAGGCGPGFHSAPGPLLYDCPQPCDTCGACSQECCLPDVADAGSDGGCEGSFSCLCGTAVCVDGGWECQGSCADAG